MRVFLCYLAAFRIYLAYDLVQFGVVWCDFGLAFGLLVFSRVEAI